MANQREITATSEKVGFNFIPDTLRNDTTSGAIVAAEGLHAFFIDDNPQLLTEYAARGVHFAKRGDGTVLNEELFQESKSGHLSNGASLIGVIKEVAYEAYKHQIAEKSHKELTGDGRMTIIKEKLV